MIKKALVILSAVSLLSACSLLSPVQMQSNTYMINTVPKVPKKPGHKVTIMVMQPVTSSIYDTTDMAYSTYPYEITYFSKNSWAETPPQMLQPLMIQALLNTHHFRAVGASGAMGIYDYVLNTQLLELQQDFTHCAASVVRLKLRAELIQNSTNQIVATREFSFAEPAPYNSPYGGVIAANRATAEMLRGLARFCLRRT